MDYKVWFWIFWFGFCSCAQSPLRVETEKRKGETFFWNYSSRLVDYSSLMGSSEGLYFGTRKGKILSLDSRNASNKWSASVQGSVDTQPLAIHSKVFLGTSEGKFYCLSSNSGKVLWSLEVNGEIVGQPQMVGPQKDILVFGANDGALYAVDSSSGNIRWRYHETLPDRMTVHSFASPAQNGNQLFAAFSNGAVVSLKIDNGEVVWRKTFSSSKRFEDLVTLQTTKDGNILLGQFEGRLFLLNSEGSILWSVEQGGSSAEPLIQGNEVFVPMGDNQVASLDLSTGQTKWVFRSPSSSHWSGLALWKQFLLCTTFEGKMLVLDSLRGFREWTYDFGSSVQGPPVIVEDQIWVLTRKGKLFSLKDRRGTKISSSHGGVAQVARAGVS